MLFFDALNLPVKIETDPSVVRKKYLQKSRESHPDFYTLTSKDARYKSLEKSTLITNAYATLRDFDKRLKYILEEENVIAADENAQLPPEFLMEMMDFNDKIMEASDKEEREQLRQQIDQLEEECKHEAQTAINEFDNGGRSKNTLAQLKEFYMKKRYLWRLGKQLKDMS